LESQGSGTGWSETWTAPSESKSAIVYDNSGNNIAIAGVDAAGDLHAFFYRTLSSSRSGTLYYSYKTLSTNTDSGEAVVNLGSGGDDGNRAEISIFRGAYRIRMNGVSSDFGTYTANTEVTLVGKITYDGMGGATMEAWVNPTGEETGEYSQTVTNSSIGFSSIDRVWLKTWNQPGHSAFDNIKIGTSWSDVAVPEPATLSLLVIGGVTLLRRKR